MVSEISVLNLGFVRLVDHMGNDLSVVRAARVSYNADWRVGTETGDSDERLIKYLWKNKHTSPFEAVVFTFEVKAPIFVFRQWHRHRTWSYNEISARYTELPNEYFLPDPETIGSQSKNNKQVRELSDLDEEKKARVIVKMDSLCMRAFHVYEGLLEDGVPRELARTVLPVATYSRMFATVDLLNLLKFLTLRTHPHAQYEIQRYAFALLELIRPIVPVCVSAWEGEK